MTDEAPGAGLLPGRWVKASRSSNADNCVEVLFDGERYHVRDSKNRGAGPVLVLDRAVWAELVRVVLGRPRGARHVVRLDDLRVDCRPDGRLVLHRGTDGTLFFTPDEVTCFVDGLMREEFTPQRSA